MRVRHLSVLKRITWSRKMISGRVPFFHRLRYSSFISSGAVVCVTERLSERRLYEVLRVSGPGLSLFPLSCLSDRLSCVSFFVCSLDNHMGGGVHHGS